MLPDPLHPAVVHFPIALALLAPLMAAGLFWSIRTGRTRARLWIGVLVFQAMLAGSGWLALETGEREEERVERVVAHRLIEEHEEAAERFMILAGLALPLAAAGLLRQPAGGVARALTVVATIASALLIGITGHKGGELVYRHGAALAYVEPGAGGPTGERTLPDAGDQKRGNEDD